MQPKINKLKKKEMPFRNVNILYKIPQENTSICFIIYFFFLSLSPSSNAVILTEYKILIKQTWLSDDILLSMKIRLQVRILTF